MPKVTPEQGAEKFSRKASAASGDYAAGVDRVTQAPGAKAVQARAKWIAKVTDPATQEKWATQTGRVGLEEWRTATKEKGVGNYSRGVQLGGAKYAAAARELYAHIQAGEDAIARLPNVSLEDGIARSSAMIRHMATFRRPGVRR